MNQLDKVPEGEKARAHIKFQEIAFAYAILSSTRRRARYDRTGRTSTGLDNNNNNDDDDDDGEEFNWTDFFRAQYATVINSATIDSFQTTYQGSEEERTEILTAYVRHRGDLDRVFEDVMLSHPIDDDARFRAIIDDALSHGRVPPFDAYLTESSRKRISRRKKAKREEGEARELARQLGIDTRLLAAAAVDAAADDDDSASKNHHHPAGAADAGEAALAALIQQRAKKRSDDFLERLEAKYATPSSGGGGGGGAAAAGAGGGGNQKNLAKVSSQKKRKRP